MEGSKEEAAWGRRVPLAFRDGFRNGFVVGRAGGVVECILIVTPYVGPTSFIVAPVTTGAGVRVCTKKLFMMIVLCGVK